MSLSQTLKSLSRLLADSFSEGLGRRFVARSLPIGINQPLGRPRCRKRKECTGKRNRTPDDQGGASGNLRGAPAKGKFMPFTDEQLDDGRGVLRLWTGAVTASDVIAANADYLTREDWTKLEYIIADFAGV